MNAAYRHCEKLVREHDRERYLAALFAPVDRRPHLFAIYAFDLEVDRIPDLVREPMAGEIRLQWWRDVVMGSRSEEASASPVAAALLDTMRRHGLKSEVLTEIIDARELALFSDPMESREALDTYLRAVVGRPMECAIRILDDGRFDDRACSHATASIGLTRVLRRLRHDISKGRLLIPLDLLAAKNVHTSEVLAGQSSKGFLAALADLRHDVRAELSRLRSVAIGEAVLPAILPATLCPLYLASMETPDYNPFHSDVGVSALRVQFALWHAARRGTI